MGIHFISGKPRGGKTLYSVQLIVEELVMGKRLVVTNVPLKLAELNAYIQKHYPKASADLHERVRILTEEEVPYFYAYRTPLGPKAFETPTEEDWKRGKCLLLDQGVGAGVFFVIDEAHLFFDARRWMEFGRSITRYLSQHAHLGDDVICITQVVGNVDKRFRGLAQDFTYVRNLSKEKIGFFRAPNSFVRSTYPQPESPSVKPMETRPFRLNLALANCYNTDAGVGILGRSDADKGRKAKGLPFWTMPALVVVGGLGVFLLCCGMGRGLGWVMTGGRKLQQKGGLMGIANEAGAKLATNNPLAAKFSSLLPPVRSEPSRLDLVRSRFSSGSVSDTNAPLVVGRMFLNGEWCGLLADGRVLRRADGFEVVDGCNMLSGRLLQWRTPPPSGPSPQDMGIATGRRIWHDY